jgi:hypothetical protein
MRETENYHHEIWRIEAEITEAGGGRVGRHDRYDAQRLAPVRFGPTIMLIAFVLTLASWETAKAADCLGSADEVRKVSPKAWPKWTYGPNHEKCWYFGKKPIFDKAQTTGRGFPQVPTPSATTEAAPNENASSVARLPWALEYRWIDSF